MQCANHIEHYQSDAELFNYFDEGRGATKEFDQRLREYIVRLCNIRPGRKVLDIGSGSGWLAKALGNRQASVTSVDLSVKNLFRIKSQLSQNSTHFVFADVYRLPFKDQTFDVVVASEVLEHLNSPEQALREIHRVLVFGGRLVASTPYKEIIQYYLCIHCNKKTPANAHLHSFDEKKLRKLFHDPRFQELRFRKFGNKVLIFLHLYYLLRFLPFPLWKLLDVIANFVVPKPAHIATLAQKR